MKAFTDERYYLMNKQSGHIDLKYNKSLDEALERLKVLDSKSKGIAKRFVVIKRLEVTKREDNGEFNERNIYEKRVYDGADL